MHDDRHRRTLVHEVQDVGVVVLEQEAASHWPDARRSVECTGRAHLGECSVDHEATLTLLAAEDLHGLGREARGADRVQKATLLAVHAVVDEEVGEFLVDDEVHHHHPAVDRDEVASDHLLEGEDRIAVRHCRAAEISVLHHERDTGLGGREAVLGVGGDDVRQRLHQTVHVREVVVARRRALHRREAGKGERVIRAGAVKRGLGLPGVLAVQTVECMGTGE